MDNPGSPPAPALGPALATQAIPPPLSPPPPPESRVASTSSSSAAGPSTPATLKLPSAMKAPQDSLESKLKRATDSPRGSLRFLLPAPVVSVREVGTGDASSDDAYDGSGREGSIYDDEDEDEGEDEDGASRRSLLRSQRAGARTKRRVNGLRSNGSSIRRERRAARRRLWRDWRGTLGLWIVLLVLGTAMGFVFVENAEEEIPNIPGDGDGGDAVRQGKILFQIISSLNQGQQEEDAEFKLDKPEKLELGLEEKEKLDLRKRQVPHDSKWLYDAQDRDNPLVPDNNTDRDKLVKGRNGAVSSDVEICSEIGVQLMKRGGNAVDSVIGTAACIGTVNMFASGVGGGGFAVIRLGNGESKSFNFREMAPKAAYRDMYNGNPLLAQRGGLAFAIPGEVDGFWRLHQKYGSLPWKDLWKPSIKLNTHGFRVTETLAWRISVQKQFFHEHRDEWEFLFSEKTGELLVEGEVMKRPQLAKTLKTISEQDGLKTFYEGWIAESLVRTARGAGGVVTKSDFAEFFTVEEETVRTRAFGREFITCQNPCSGPALIEALNIAEGLNLTDASSNITIHRVVEIMKWMSAGRTELGDPTDTEVFNGPRVQELTTLEFAESVRRNISDSTTYPWKHYNPSYEPNEPKGTSHISVLDPFGNAVALTTTVNLYFGALIHDTNTGIVLNSEMDDFSIPGRPNAYDLSPSIFNYIKPLKRPLSSTAPTISVERDGKVGLVIGASGGSRIVTSVFACIVKSYLWGFDLLDVVKSARIHHQLVPEVAYVERGVSEEVIEGLRERGHIVQVVNQIGSVVGAVRRVEDGTIWAVADWWRKRGKAAGF